MRPARASAQRAPARPPSALVVIDVQVGFEDPRWGPRNNPDSESNILRLIEAWLSVGWPLVLVRHDSRDPASPLAPGSAGNAIKQSVARAAAGFELLVVKHVNSAFYGTPDLRAWLEDNEIPAVVICGITTNHCCESTARMAANLGFQTSLALDATHTFDRQGPDGEWLSAAQLSQATAANLHGEFAAVLSTREVLAALPADDEVRAEVDL